MIQLLDNSSRPMRQCLLVAAIMLVLCWISYGPGLSAPEYWDDAKWLTGNAAVAHSDLSWIWTHHRSTASYYPLTLTSFWIEYHIWGYWLPGYRAVNILLHCASAVMLWWILKKIRVPGALLAATVWAVHPIQAESVLWITERKNMLSGVFFFATLIYWIRAIGRDVMQKQDWHAYTAAIFLCVLALLAKSAAVFLPVAALGIGWLYVGKLRKRDVLLSLPLFAAALTMALVTMYFERYQASNDFGKDWDLSIAQRIILSGKCFWFYIGKILWPDQFAFIYSRWNLQADQPLEYLGFVSAILLFAALLWLAWKKKIVSPLVGMTLYLAGIFPIIGFLKFYTQIFTYVADHYAYLASAAMIALTAGLFAAGWRALASRAESFKRFNWLASTVGIILIVGLVALSCGQALLYRSFLATWQETLRITPTASVAHNEIGMYVFQHEGNVPLALEHFLDGLKYSRDPRILGNAGYAMQTLGRTAEARTFYEEAITRKTSHHTPYLQLALMELAANNPARAIELCKNGIKQTEYEPSLWWALGQAYRQAGKLDKSAEAFVHCLELDPNAPGVYLALADIAFDKGAYPVAVNLYLQARQTDPMNPRLRMNLAAALRRTGREQEAQAEEAAARQLQPTVSGTTQPVSR